jgi:hypothetical protein
MGGFEDDLGPFRQPPAFRFHKSPIFKNRLDGM